MRKGVPHGTRRASETHRERHGTCGKDDCPNVYRTASGSIIVQGDVSTAFRPPDGEGIVEIPEETLREAFRALGW